MTKMVKWCLNINLKIGFIFFIFPQFLLAQNLNGLWRLELPTAAGTLPFHIRFFTQNNKLNAALKNGKEEIVFDKVETKKDSLILSMDVFDAVFKLKTNSNKLTGSFTKRMADLSYRSGSVKGQRGLTYRFIPNGPSKIKLAETYEVIFNDKGTTYPAVAKFKQLGNYVSGTFLTETGDYRFLEGNIIKDSLKLSCLEGNHIFLFKAKIAKDRLENGTFTYNFIDGETWEGKANAEAELKNAYSLTYLNPGYTKVDFRFKNIDGKTVSLSDEYFKNKVTVIQILGTWCPNCMDETKFLAKFYDQNPQVAVVGLAFEKSTEESFAFPKIKAVKDRFKVNYPILLAGKNDKAEASEKLPMLNKIISFPTTIIIDKKGEVRKIHTGFSGPATGKYYEDFVKEFNELMVSLSKE